MAGCWRSGANVFNMAIAGVLAGYLPYALLRGRPSGCVSGRDVFGDGRAPLLALGELLRSGVPMPPAALVVSLGLFVVSAIAEGAITLAVVQALGRIEPGLLRRPQGFAAEPACSGQLHLHWRLPGSSSHPQRPDGIQKLVLHSGIAAHARMLLRSPLADYKLHVLASPFLTRSLAGLIGLFVYLCASRRVCGRFSPSGAGRRLVAARANGALEPGTTASFTDVIAAAKILAHSPY